MTTSPSLPLADSHWYMMTSSNGNIFRVTFVRRNHRSPVNSPHKGSDPELWCFFDLRLNKRLSNQSWGWWLATLWRQLWRHCNVATQTLHARFHAQDVSIKTGFNKGRCWIPRLPSFTCRFFSSRYFACVFQTLNYWTPFVIYGRTMYWKRGPDSSSDVWCHVFFVVMTALLN